MPLPLIAIDLKEIKRPPLQTGALRCRLPARVPIFYGEQQFPEEPKSEHSLRHFLCLFVPISATIGLQSQGSTRFTSEM